MDAKTLEELHRLAISNLRTTMDIVASREDADLAARLAVLLGDTSHTAIGIQTAALLAESR